MAYDYQGISLSLANKNASGTSVSEAFLVFGGSFGKKELVSFI
jgi:hypothetical protein